MVCQKMADWLQRGSRCVSLHGSSPAVACPVLSNPCPMVVLPGFLGGLTPERLDMSWTGLDMSAGIHA